MIKLPLINLTWPFERIWTQSLDFRSEEAVSIYDFFDHVQEKKSPYGIWLFNAVSVSPDRTINFSEYIHVVTYFSFLGKLDVMKIIFKFKCNGDTTHLLKEDWISLIDDMLSNESVQYSKKGAIIAFDKHASSDVHGKKLLFFDDFRRVSTN